MAGELTGPSFSGIGAAPTVVSATALDSLYVRVVFSEPMSSVGLTTPGNYTIASGRTVVSVTQISSTTVVLKLNNHTVPGTNNYTVTASGFLSDTVGNFLGTPNSATFSGTNNGRPTLVSAQALDATHVLVTFSEAMDTTDLTNVGYYIVLGPSAPTVVHASIASVNSARLTLSTSMLAGTYTVTVDSAFRDTSAYVIIAPLSATFAGIAAQTHTTPEITDHCQFAINRLASQFRGKSNIETLICIFADKIQELEQALNDLAAFDDLEEAYGAGLDAIGQLYNLPRQGMLDDEYRINLKAASLTVNSEGTPDELLNILTLLDDGYNAAAITLVEHYPASALMHRMIAAGDYVKAVREARLIFRAKPAGVRLNLEFEETGVQLFEWSASGTGLGWSNAANPTIGGSWAHSVGM